MIEQQTAMNESGYELLTISQLFNHGKRAFRVPDYQRGYSWEFDQRNDLRKDIEYLVNARSEDGTYPYRHYTGTVVASLTMEKDRAAGIETFDVVDGQQRLTTLIILLSCLARKMSGTDESVEIFRVFVEEQIRPGNTVRKFFSADEQDEVFEQLVRSGCLDGKRLTCKSSQNLADAVQEFEAWLNSAECDPLEILNCIQSQLGFLYFAPRNDKEVGIMFEVINNRGKRLSELEKIKNYLIYYGEKNALPDIKSKVNKAWPHILSRLNQVGVHSNDAENAFLRNCWITFQDHNKSRSHHVYANLKEYWPPEVAKDVGRLLYFIRFVEKAALTYLKLHTGDGVQYDEGQWLKRLSLHPQNASVLPLLLAIYERVEDGEERAQLVELLEKLNFRFYGSGKAGRADSGQGDLFRMANIVQGHWQGDYEGDLCDFNWLRSELIGFIDRSASDMDFVKYLTLDKDEGGDYYRWSGLKFFLASYEESLRNAKSESADLSKLLQKSDPLYFNDSMHKEHIWATADHSKVNVWGDPALSLHKRRLGNFILLKPSQNIKVSNDPPEGKIDLYWKDRENDPNTLMIRELKLWFDDAYAMESKEGGRVRQTWRFWMNVYQRFLDHREEKMVNFALERWRVPELSRIVNRVTINSRTDENEIYKISYED